ACNDSAIRLAMSLSTPKDVSQLPIVGVCPAMGISLRVDQLNSDSHVVGRFLHAAFKNVRYAKLLSDLAQIPRFALILLRGSARNDFQVCDARQPRQDLLLNPVAEIGVI